MTRPLVTEKDVESILAAGGKSPALPEGALLTPAARDLLRRRGLDPEAVARRGLAARRLCIANWKSNKTVAQAKAWAAELAGLLASPTATAPTATAPTATAIVCPPHTALHPLCEALRGVAELGAQDVSASPEGAFTGEVAAKHLADVGCRWALVGHSERRAGGETDETARRKVRAALREPLSPVLCVGETADERRAGRTQTVVSDQLRAALEGLLPEEAPRVVVAYEPRWAIGAGVTPSEAEVTDVLSHVRAVLARLFGDDLAARQSVLYGGSVTEKNAAALLRLPGCSGALVGGASLQAPTFAAILRAT